MIRDKIELEAKEWIGTPFAHYQCCKGVGVDCAHLIIGVGKNTQLLPLEFSVPYYSPQWYIHEESSLLVDTLIAANFRQKSVSNRLYGDVLVFKFERNACHVGIFLQNNTILHARFSKSTRCVVHHHLIPMWERSYLRHCYAFPGVDDL